MSGDRSAVPGAAQYKTFQIQIDGRTYSGAWHMDVGMVHVSSAYGSRSASAGPRPEKTAEGLLREIVPHPGGPQT